MSHSYKRIAIVDRDDDTLASTRRMWDYDFVLRMTTIQVSDAFVRDAIESVSVEDRERLKAAVRRPYSNPLVRMGHPSFAFFSQAYGRPRACRH